MKVIRLSAATQELERSVICNVHGVNPRFLEIGQQKQKEREIGGGNSAYLKGAYYIGKMVWGKGYTELIQLLSEHQTKLTGLKMELYGNGEDADEVKQAAAKLKLDVTVLPGRDHADPIFHE
jgi:digalactosyldiacylglycerol synthase